MTGLTPRMLAVRAVAEHATKGHECQECVRTIESAIQIALRDARVQWEMEDRQAIMVTLEKRAEARQDYICSHCCVQEHGQCLDRARCDCTACLREDRVRLENQIKRAAAIRAEGRL